MTKLFCSQPFEHFEVQTNGLAYLCCPGWMPQPVGDARSGNPEKIWNAPLAQRVRESILDGSFRYCTGCPFLTTRQGPVRAVEDVTNPEHLAIIRDQRKVIERIKILNLAYDSTCNLSCPSCRTRVKVASGQKLRRLQTFQETLVTPELLRSLDLLYVTGSGDPFASSVFRTLLRSIDARDYPSLRIFLHTNALLFTVENWRAMDRAHPLIHTVSVSIDAATPETYAINRRGGEWTRLLERLDFIRGLRRESSIKELIFNFVVQSNNWREMPNFMLLARNHEVDEVLFTPLKNWSTFSPEEFSERAVHVRSHPDNGAFVRMLATEPLLRDPRAIVTDFS
jgi:wyosine [tRNA(Phe)-imidazoG37] synthetase (radical SAM superfamily)